MPSARLGQELCPACPQPRGGQGPLRLHHLRSPQVPRRRCWLPSGCLTPAVKQQSGHAPAVTYLIHSFKCSDLEIWLSCNWESPLQSCLLHVEFTACSCWHRFSWFHHFLDCCSLLGRKDGNHVLLQASLLWPFLIGHIFLNVFLFLLSLFRISLFAFLTKWDIVCTEECIDVLHVITDSICLFV